MKVTAKAPANIAFIKYWGKKNENLRLPANSSISMNLSEAYTVTTVEADRYLTSDKVFIDGKHLTGEELKRISKYIDLIRSRAKVKSFVRVESNNNFPKGAGIASSASGFAALTLAAAKAFGLSLSEKELSILARKGSGSASRSIPDGFVEWVAGKDDKSSFAKSLYPPDYWDITDVIAIVGEKSKKVSSTEGHAVAGTSPLYKARIRGMPAKIAKIKKALKDKDFTKFGEILESEAINMHLVMMTSRPPLYYWLPATLKIIEEVIRWRRWGLESYFTIDAGPNVHIICRLKDADRVKTRLKKIGVGRILVNKPAEGVKII